LKLPSLQFYPADWLSNAKLRRCSEAARGAWLDIICLLHRSEEYGVCRWPLADLIRASAVSAKSARELIEKGVLKGGDKGCEAFVYVPRHGGREGDPVELIAACEGPCWYSSRMVRDAHVRKVRGMGSRFTEEKQPPKQGPKRTPKAKPKQREGKLPKSAPKGGIGGRQGDGASASSSASEEEPPPPPSIRDMFVEPLCTLAQARSYGASCGLTEDQAEWWWHDREARGWHSGGPGNAPIRRWQSDMKRSAGWVKEASAKGAASDGKARNFNASQITI
jgi:hypothetical protein